MQAFPRWVYPRTSPDVLDGIDIFLSAQMDQFNHSGPRYVQTYRMPGKVEAQNSVLFFGGDTYDTALTAIYFLERGNLTRAADLANALYLAIMHDSIGGGRVATATDARSLYSPENHYCTNVIISEGDSTEVGCMAWAGLALCRAYAYIKNACYLEGAILIGNWILKNTKKEDKMKGFTGGEEWGIARKWRSVEQNTLAYALFRALSSLTRDPIWEDNMEHARFFITYCYDDIKGLFCTGVGADGKIESAFPSDAQIAFALSEIDPALNTGLLKNLATDFWHTAKKFEGIRFSTEGTGIHNERTASAAFALHISGEVELAPYADRLFESLERQIGSAPNTDKHGLVATPHEEADTGMGWKFYNWLHCASTAWAGLAFLAKSKPSCNPYLLPPH